LPGASVRRVAQIIESENGLCPYTTRVAPAVRDLGTTTNLVSCADVM
jgi:hypothetical protein